REEGDESVVRNIRIDGDWFVFEKDALGQPAAYGLRVMVAWQSPQDKAEGKDLVTVFELSMVSRDAKPAAPFKLAAVGGSFWMRASKVPQAK
ncbi:MAG: hypothetical protein HYU66_26620, partial [Armatimonadetes bacterium]|nr:hypothetical protein [Armatimonadota bacterium]